jgi:hypothetical protein
MMGQIKEGIPLSCNRMLLLVFLSDGLLEVNQPLPVLRFFSLPFLRFFVVQFVTDGPMNRCPRLSLLSLAL